MKEGQVFTIIAEESDGPLGTRINALKIDTGATSYKIPEDKPAVLKL